jgi:hypothetical protein
MLKKPGSQLQKVWTILLSSSEKEILTLASEQRVLAREFPTPAPAMERGSSSDGKGSKSKS